LSLPEIDASTLREWFEKGLISAKDAGIETDKVNHNNSTNEFLNKVKPEKKATAKLSLSILISPLTLKSEANAGGKLRDKIARKSAVKSAIVHALPDMRFPLPVVVKLTRISIKKCDDDNLRSTLKAVRDSVAAWLGVDDADPRIKWEYGQRAGYVAGCMIRIKTRHI
jgi:hypothetical protein